jgi:hypothetical protein
VAETATISSRWEVLEQRSAVAFLVAGVFWLSDTVLLGLEMIDIYTSGLLNGVFLIIALLTSMVGLLGFYPNLADKRPRLALTCAIIVAIAVGGLVIALIWQLGAMALTGVSTPPGFVIVSPLLGFVLVGGASLRDAVPSRIIGVLLLLNVGVLVVAAAMTGWVQFGLVAVTGIIAVAISYRLRSEFISADSVEPAPNTTTR